MVKLEVNKFITGLSLLYNYVITTNCFDGNKVLSYNVWGISQTLGFSEYLSERMDGIAHEISKGDYDLYLLQEVWSEMAYNIIKAKIPANYQITDYKVGTLKETCKKAISAISDMDEGNSVIILV